MLRLLYLKDLEFPPVAERYLITWDLYTELVWNGLKIKALPAYLFLLNFD
ncbi:hypothetical protein [Pseudothermotoga lettingae]|nr:hypothetical protein [Pseudothermotoga lettingae]